MKSIFILLFFLLIIWLTYNYSYNRFYTDKIEKDIKYLLLPESIDNQFKYGKLETNFRDTFEKSSLNINYVPKVSGIEATKQISLQRYFTEF
jgi:hypothetical protein